MGVSEKDLLSLRQKTFAQLRQASDTVRGELIPTLNTEKASLKDSYFQINQRYFENDVLHGQMVGGNDFESYVENGDADEFYQSTLEDITSLRRTRANVAGFETLHPRFLGLISSRMFNAMDEVRSFNTVKELQNFLSVADTLFQISHFCKDGSGRTGEDTLVLYGERQGFSLTFSQTGYRAVLDGSDRLLFFRHVTEKVFHAEVVRNFFKWVGLEPPLDIPTHIRDLLRRLVDMNNAPRQPRLGLPNNSDEAVSEILTPLEFGQNETQPELQLNHPYRLYATFIARECVFMTLCLSDMPALFPALCQRYPLTLACRVRDLEHAQTQSYLNIPPDIADIADETVARLDLNRMGKLSDNEAFDQRVDLIEKPQPQLARLIRAEKGRAALRALLSRVRLPVRPNMTADDLRSAIQASMSWDL